MAFNEHIPTYAQRQRVKDLAIAGIPKYIIARIIEIDEATLKKRYRKELDTAQAEQVERISKVVALQAENGNEKSQALYLKTQGAKFGWVEKQVIEQTSNEETQAMRDKIAELESKYERDY